MSVSMTQFIGNAEIFLILRHFFSAAYFARLAGDMHLPRPRRCSDDDEHRIRGSRHWRSRRECGNLWEHNVELGFEQFRGGALHAASEFANH
jgi:hypothetical protein